MAAPVGKRAKKTPLRQAIGSPGGKIFPEKPSEPKPLKKSCGEKTKRQEIVLIPQMAENCANGGVICCIGFTPHDEGYEPTKGWDVSKNTHGEI